ncbi:threonine synthase [Candidatus Schneideria nysicola]|uniref:threonine synthase n=1 Tax=Candidatus Schneideria nysicola TaxID=1081631 RepID=UPI001CAA47A8|nr:threonine synthase [Candidatus Schneideria nysicola]UAJ65174.1 threonine synthase [Candidatus Schneideria nysicola]
MRLYNIKDYNEQVDFAEAIQRGLGSNKGLFFPVELPHFNSREIDELLNMDFITRSAHILSTYINEDTEEIPFQQIVKCVKNAFTFSIPLKYLSHNMAILELFHGPTLSFKDFGIRLMAQILMAIAQKPYNKPFIILTATSGDTGAAVAHAFYGIDSIKIIILYPKNKISVLQEKMFCTLGKNISTLSVDGQFDICQSLVKEAFDDKEINKKFTINSANSINISRLLAQICYYFEAVAQIPPVLRDKLVISVPSGNFGNLTAGLLAQSLGLPIKRFIAATNVNDTVPRFLKDGKWNPYPTISTLSNAMDVSQPNNWPRIEELFSRKNWSFSTLAYGSVDDETTRHTLYEMKKEINYISEPHTAIAYRLLRDQIQPGEYGIVIGTAHPAKFQNVVETILDTHIILPPTLQSRSKLPILSKDMKADYGIFRDIILQYSIDREGR